MALAAVRTLRLRIGGLVLAHGMEFHVDGWLGRRGGTGMFLRPGFLARRRRSVGYLRCRESRGRRGRSGIGALRVLALVRTLSAFASIRSLAALASASSATPATPRALAIGTLTRLILGTGFQAGLRLRVR